MCERHCCAKDQLRVVHQLLHKILEVRQICHRQQLAEHSVTDMTKGCASGFVQGG